MIGVLFHGAEVFDSGWAARLLRAFPRARFMLAGTMSRTALHDSGLKGVETPGLQPSRCVKLLAEDCSAVLLATFSKSTRSGLVFGSLVADRSGGKFPLAQAEFSGLVYSVHSGNCPASLFAVLKKLGLAPAESPQSRIDLWHERGLLFRSMTTANKGDFVLVNGIVIGRAIGGTVILGCKERAIKEVRGVIVKAHGLEKLERLGGVDLEQAKLASAPQLRRKGVVARRVTSSGSGVVFIDHAGMHVYDLAAGAAGAVTVGDDTTAVAGDILRRYGVPVIGIVDGDGDGLYKGSLAPGSLLLTVKADDKAGLCVRRSVFGGKNRTDKDFNTVLSEISELLRDDILSSFGKK